MEVYRKLAPNKNVAIALGFFDGMHPGHKKVIKILVEKAKAEEIKSAVITFDTNPADYFNPEPTLNIQTYKDRQLIMSSMDVDYLYELDFETVKNMSAQEYLKDVLIKYFNPKYIVVGYNHTFGKDRQGDSDFLKQFESKYGYETIVISEQKYNNKEEISSSAIRTRIENGHLNAVKALLGRSFSVRNSVIKGDKVASSLGYPTANIIWPVSMVKLPYGVYYGFCQIASKLHPALISWGNKPTLTSGEEEILETHIYDFDENLYGKIIKVIFIKQVREQKTLSSKQALKAQLDEDYTGFKNWIKATLK